MRYTPKEIGYLNPSSKWAKNKRLKRNIAVKIDNGSEYLGIFDKYLKEKHIKHLFTYPRCPRVNGYIERANRTLQEEFLDYYLFLLLDDIKAFNSQLIDYLI
jgi:transposase InsO family protein